MTAAAVFAFGFANAQEGGFSKGDVFVTGSFGIMSEKEGNLKSTGFEFAPKAGFFVTSNIAVGGTLGYANLKEENGNLKTEDRSQFNIGAFGRYFFTPASKFSLFGELGVNHSSINNNINDAKEKEIGANVGLGLNYFVSKNFSIEATWAGLGFSSNDNGGNGADKTNSFGIGADLSSINFGLTYKF